MATYSDDFNRANSGSNSGWGANWLHYAEGTLSNTGWEVLSNQGRSVASFTLRTARWNGGSVGADQFSQATLVTAPTDGGSQVMVRASDGNNFYIGGQLNTGAWRISKYVGGVQTALATDTDAPLPANGDVIRLEAQGTALRLYVNSTLRLSTTDSDLTTGQPGVRVTNSTDWDNWSGGDLSGGSSTTVNPSTGAISIQGLAPSSNAFTNVRYQEVLINAAGSPVSNRTGMRFSVWYSGQCSGAPDLSYSDLTTGAAGTASYSLATGSLVFGQKVFGVITDGGTSLSSFTCGLLTLTYT